MTTYNRKEFIRILRNNGYFPVRKSGGHTIFRNEQKNDSLSLQLRTNKMVCRRLIKEHNLEI